MIFIRPLLLLLILIPLFFRFIRKRSTPKTTWDKWVDKKLLPSLLITENQSKKLGVWRLSLILLWVGFVLAATGIAFQKVPVPVVNTMPNTVIIFDLGPSMQGQTLAAAKIKLHDLLTALKGNRVGLVLYADQGFTAVPLTPDRSIVRSLIPTLDASVLPSSGQNLAKGFEEANQLIKQTGGKGRILYLTAGGIEARDIKTPYPVGVLGMDDAAISNKIKQLGTYRAKTVDASDILSLLQATQPDQAVQFDDENQADEWADLGALITLILLPFMALTFRKQWLFLMLFMLSANAQAAFFQRPDQIAYQQEQIAVQDYRAGRYEQAVYGFQNNPYNRGNALAYAGEIEQAIQSYDEALKINPNDEDARFNKEYLEKQLPPPEQQQNQQKQDQQSDAGQNNEDQQSSDNQDQNREEQSQPQQAESEPQQQDQQQDENQQQMEIVEQDQEETPFDQEEQQILNRLQHDPYRVLRYRLLQQARKK